MVRWNRDADHDNWGDRSYYVMAPLVAPPIGYVHRYGDCNDHNPRVTPYHGECYTQRDNSPYPGRPYDIDGDGHLASIAPEGHREDDCDDTNPDEYPGKYETAGNDGQDHDCNPFTGGVLDCDPQFIDPRPHMVPLSLQQFFDGDGRLRTFNVGFDRPMMVSPDYVSCTDVAYCNVYATPPNNSAVSHVIFP